jgi:hypothetical protein
MATSKARDDARLLRRAAQASERQEAQDDSHLMLYNVMLILDDEGGSDEDLGGWRERVISKFSECGGTLDVSPELEDTGLTSEERTLGLCFAAAMAETGDL